MREIKLVYEDEIRLVEIGDDSSKLPFTNLKSFVVELYSLPDNDFRVQWKDGEEEMVTISTCTELVRAMDKMKSSPPESTPKFFITRIKSNPNSVDQAGRASLASHGPLVGYQMKGEVGQEKSLTTPQENELMIDQHHLPAGAQLHNDSNYDRSSSGRRPLQADPASESNPESKRRKHSVIDEYTSSAAITMLPATILDYLYSLQPKDRMGSYTKDVTSLSSADLGRPFVGRDETIKAAASVYSANNIAYKTNNLRDRNNYRIPAAAAIPGMGKTHMLNKLREVLAQAGVPVVHMAIIVQYYNGQSEQWIDRNLSVECALAWRILCVVFIRECGWDFAEFCCMQMLPRNCHLLVLRTCLQTLRLALVNDPTVAFGAEDTMVLSLGIDEFQRIASTEEGQKSKLAELCMKLFECSYSTTVHMYPMLAGTDWALLRHAGRSSGIPIERLSMPLMGPKQVDQMVRQLLGDLPFTASLVCKHLYVLGSLPRTALTYAKTVKQLLAGGARLEEQEITEVFCKVFNSFSGVWDDVPSLQAKLLALCFSMTDVAGGYILQYCDNNGQPRSVNVWKLADSGYCLINGVPGRTGAFVSVPYLLVHIFSQCRPNQFKTESEKCLLHSVQWMVKNVDDCLYAKQRWELCKDFGCAYMACRINSLLVLGIDKVTVGELWTGALCKLPSARNEMLLKLRPTEVVRTSAQLSKDMGEEIVEMGTGRTLNWLRGSETRAYVFRNGLNGAKSGNFFCLPVEGKSDGFLPFLEQTEISVAKVKSLCEAQFAVCPSGYTPVCCLRNAYPRMIKQDELPDNCVVVLRGQLRHFYGMFSDHPAATAHVNVNECNRAQLQTLQPKMAGGSIEGAVDLIWERVQQAKFASQAEFNEFLYDNGIEISAIDVSDCVWPREEPEY